MAEVKHYRHKKHYGQHFLHDSAIISYIVSSLNLSDDQHWIEIGPGGGVLTRQIYLKVASLTAIEVDKDLWPELEKLSSQSDNFELLKQDVLTIDWRNFKPKEPLFICGNLPYNISTPILFSLLTTPIKWAAMHFMLQKEVVARMVAKPGSKDYGRLSVMTQYFSNAQAGRIIRPGAFNPPPKVDSQLVDLRPYVEKPATASNQNLFANLVRLAFNQRRKMLRKVFKDKIPITAWPEVQLEATSRAEELSVGDFVRLANWCTNSSIII